MEHTNDIFFCLEFVTPVDPKDTATINERLRDAIVVEGSESFAKYLGLSGRDQLVGRNINDFTGGEVPEWFRAYGQSVEDNDFEDEERVVEARAGQRTRYIRIHMQNIVEEGKLVRQWITTRDVTAEEERKRLILAMEEKIRTADRLESLGVLAGGLAHDFNNLLMAIRGSAELAQERSDGLDDYFERIVKSCDEASGLCDQLNTLAGQTPPRVSSVNIASEVAQVVNTSSYLRLGNVEIRQDIDEASSWIRGDRTQIQRLISNLIENAVEACADAQGKVVVTLKTLSYEQGWASRYHLGNELKPGSYVCIEVSDNGHGMDEEHVDRIFEPFFTTRLEGRGLGMAVVLGIVRGHQGGIGVDSKSGVGTTVHVLLPRSEGEDDEE